MNLVTITAATVNDVPQIENLVNSAYRGDTSRQGWTTEADVLDGIRIDQPALEEIIYRKDAVILKGTDENNDLICCVYLHQQKDELYLGMLTVKPQLQAHGIGKQLLLASENHARKSDCNSIVMTVLSNRAELIAWYERHGYLSTGERKPFPNDTRFGIPKQPLEFVILKKQLQS